MDGLGSFHSYLSRELVGSYDSIMCDSMDTEALTTPLEPPFCRAKPSDSATRSTGCHSFFRTSSAPAMRVDLLGGDQA